ncbi:MAG: hypothetical protein AAF663_00125 [Planctomycetota bacterium]
MSNSRRPQRGIGQHRNGDGLGAQVSANATAINDLTGAVAGVVKEVKHLTASQEGITSDLKEFMRDQREAFAEQSKEGSFSQQLPKITAIVAVLLTLVSLIFGVIAFLVLSPISNNMVRIESAAVVAMDEMQAEFRRHQDNHGHSATVADLSSLTTQSVAASGRMDRIESQVTFLQGENANHKEQTKEQARLSERIEQYDHRLGQLELRAGSNGWSFAQQQEYERAQAALAAERELRLQERLEVVQEMARQLQQLEERFHQSIVTRSVQVVGPTNSP